MNRCALVITLVLTTLAVGRRIDRAKGRSTEITNSVELQVATDPFEGFASCVKSAESGCKATGWKATYHCPSAGVNKITPPETSESTKPSESESQPGQASSISVKIKPTGKVSIMFGDDFLNSFSAAQQNSLAVLTGKKSLKEVNDLHCTPFMKEFIPNACGFYTHKNIASVCGLETVTWVGDKFEIVKGGMKDVFKEARKPVTAAQQPLHPMGDGLGPLIQIAEGTGCTKKGWKGIYFSMGTVKVLTVKIEGSNTTIKINKDFVEALPDSLRSGMEIVTKLPERFQALQSERTTKEVKDLVCADPAILEKFPDACPFFRFKHLGFLCPKSLGMRNFGNKIKRGGKKIWDAAKGLFSHVDDFDGFDD